ncbi:phosphoenolpyruvate phosphomutase, partial [Bradyrhizobium sp. UFLA01-814]
VSTVIWANHAMRAAIAAMRQVCHRILTEESTASIESNVATLDEVFGLLRYDELARAEARYLPPPD